MYSIGCMQNESKLNYQFSYIECKSSKGKSLFKLSKSILN